jgi:hypothetical protein
MCNVARILLLALPALALVGCATNGGHAPVVEDAPTVVSPYRYSALTCTQLAFERRDTAYMLDSEQREQKKNPGGDLWDMVTSGPLLGTSTEYGRFVPIPDLKGQLIAIDAAAKTCHN